MIACVIPEAHRTRLREGGSIELTLLPPAVMVRRVGRTSGQVAELYVCAGDARRHLHLAGARGTVQRRAPPSVQELGLSPAGKTRFFLTACVMVRGVDDRLLEWVEYHRLVGVEHFYVYDNSVHVSANVSTTTATHRLLQPYIEAGVVTYVPWPVQYLCFKFWNMQFAQQVSCMRRFGDETEWMAHLVRPSHWWQHQCSLMSADAL